MKTIQHIFQMQLSQKEMIRAKRILAIFMLPVMVFYMTSLNLLAVNVAKAADEVVAEVVADPAPAPKAEPKVEPKVEVAAPAPVPAEEPAPVVKEPAPVVEPVPAVVEPVIEPVIEPVVESDPVVETSPTPGVITPEAASTSSLQAAFVEAIAADPIVEVVAPVEVASEVPAPVVETWGGAVGNKTTTNAPVQIGTTYVAPQNKEVTVKFTDIKGDSGKLSIEEITLTPEQVKTLGALSNKAYDITSDMADGTFAYDLTLPKPANQENVEIKFAENVAGLKDADSVPSGDVDVNNSNVSASLNHFTIFVLTIPTPDSEKPVLINEIFVNSVGGGQEWVELYNNTDNEINLSGWKIKDGSHEFEDISSLGKIPARGLTVFYHADSWLNDSSPENVTVNNGTEDVDSVEIGGISGAVIAHYPAEGESVGRITDGGSAWSIMTKPTEGYTNANSTVYVDDNGITNEEFGTSAHPFKTIQKGIDSVATGGTVNVAAGEYTGNLIIDKSLTLIGVGDTTIINGGIDATGANVTIQDLKITNQNSKYPSGSTFYYGVKATAGKALTLENVTLDVLYYGVYMIDGSSTSGTAITLNDSHIKGYAAIYLKGAGATNAVVSVFNTSLLGRIKSSGPNDDFAVIAVYNTSGVQINFTGTSSVVNEFTDGAQAKEHLILFVNANNVAVTGTPTYTNAANSTVSSGAKFSSFPTPYPNTVEGQVVARFVYNTLTFEDALADNSVITPIEIARYTTAINTTAGTKTLNAGTTLIIEDNTPTTITAGTTLVNNGTIIIETGATFTNNGIINGTGTISGTVGGTGTIELCVNTGGASGCFSSIQTAVSAAPSGAIINVAAGTYAEAVTIDKILILTGTGNPTATSFTLNSGADLTGSSDITASTININDGAKIQDGILLVSSGGTVNVGAGIYYEQVIIDKAVSVLGAGAATTFIDGTGVTPVLPGLVNITNETGAVTLDGFTIRNAPASGGIKPTRIAIWAKQAEEGPVYSSSMTITHNILVGNYLVSTDDYGLYSNYNKSNLVFSYNDVSNFGGNALLFELHTGPAEISHNNIIVIPSGPTAIFSMSYKGGYANNNDVTGKQWLHDNTINANGGSAIVMASAFGEKGYNERTNGKYTNVEITGNIITNVGDASKGIQLEVDGDNGGFVNPLITGNTISAKNPGSGTSRGIRIMGVVTGAQITDNEITGFHQGIYQMGTWGQPIYATGTVISGNVITGGAYGIDIAGGTATIHLNSIVGNTLFGVNNQTAAMIDATNNWWGNASGPGDVGLGTGDKVSTNVNLDSWYIDAEMTTTNIDLADATAAVEAAEADPLESKLATANELVGMLPDSSDKTALENRITAATFDGISAELVAIDVANNLGDVDASNITHFSNLYFEKSVDGNKVGKITFTASLDLSSDATQTFLQNLGTYMEANAGSMKFDARTATELKAAGAEIRMYGINALGYTDVTPIIVRDDAGNILSEGDTGYPTLSDISYAAGDGGTLIFSTNHFTQFDLPGQKQTTPDGSGNATLSGDTTEVVLTDPNQNVTVNIADGTENPTIDVSAFISLVGGKMTGTLPGITINSSAADVVIPDGTVVTGPADWDGIIDAPRVVTSAGTAPSGFAVGDNIIEIGSSDGVLYFGQAVKITLPGVTGTVAYKPAGSDVWTEITTECNSATDHNNINSVSPKECYFHDAGNTIIWTYHFTSFGGLTDTQNPVITITGENPWSHHQGTVYVEQGATWTDNVDGSGNDTTITGSVDHNNPDTYYITYSYTDASGNTGTATRTVTVKKTDSNGNGGGGGGAAAAGVSTAAAAGGTALGTETSTEGQPTVTEGQPTVTEEPQGETPQGNQGQVLGEEAANPSGGNGLALWQWLLIVFVLGGAGYYGYGVYRGRRDQTIR